MAQAHVSYSLTETQHFRCLVDFVSDVQRYAGEHRDIGLQALVDELHDELRALTHGEWD